MNEKMRLAATLVIWIAVVAVIGSTLTSPVGAVSHASDGTLFSIVAVIFFSAMISTMAVWLAGWRTAALMRDDYAASKQKRLVRERLGQDQLARLLEQLDDEDVYDLEALLLSREGDGELPRRRPQHRG